ncbi:MAG: Uma2 family endonuclease [Brasilonema sp.]
MSVEFKIKLRAISDITEEQFYQICRDNSDIKFERSAEGEILIMSPTGGETGIRNFDIIGQFWLWNNTYQLGYCFDSSTCFKLPNGANRSPDVAFIIKERWESLSSKQREAFPPIAPDFVLELMSPSDSLKDTQDKMQEYMNNGVKLGWSINRKNRQVEIYRQSRDKQILDVPECLSGEGILLGFTLNLKSIW